MRRRRLLLLLSCGLWYAVAISAARASNLSVAFEVLKINPRFSGTEAPMFTAVRSKDEWVALRSKLISSHHHDSVPLDLPSASEIDFSRYTLVVAGLGMRPNAGYYVLVRDVYDGTSSIVIGIVELMPGPDCATAQELTFPMTMALIPRSTKPVDFFVNKASVDCKPLRYPGGAR